MKNWEDEEHLRLYRKTLKILDTCTWEARSIYVELLKTCSKLGKLKTQQNVWYFAAPILGISEDILRKNYAQLVDVGLIEVHSDGIYLPDFVESQVNIGSPHEATGKQMGLFTEGECGKMPQFDFEKIYRQYPRKAGKRAGMARARRAIRTRAHYSCLARAVERVAKNYLGQDTTYCPYWSTFINQEMYLDEELPSPHKAGIDTSGSYQPKGTVAYDRLGNPLNSDGEIIC